MTGDQLDAQSAGCLELPFTGIPPAPTIGRDGRRQEIRPSMQPILTPNELLQRSPPPAARDSTETDASVTSPLRQNAAADSFHAAGGAVDGNIHSLLQSDRSTLEECAHFFKSVVAGSLLEAGAAAEETARVQKVKSHWLPCTKRLPSLPFCALGAGLRPHNQPLCQVPARRRPRVSRDAASRPGQKWTSTAHGR